MIRTKAAVAALASLLMASAALAEPRESSVAVEQVTIGTPAEPMAMAIWHPAEMSGGALPLVVISHGTGAGPMAHVDTAEALAAAGFVVAAPMHRGDNFQEDKVVGRPEWMASRSRDVSEAITFLLRQWPAHARLSGRVGIFGFSAGATTALVSAGGILDLGRIAPHCAAHPEFVCSLIAGEVAQAPTRWTRDSRIAAAVLAAPGLGFAFAPSGLDAVAVPVQIWIGSADRTVPYETNAAVVRRLLPGEVELRQVDNAAHLSFLAPCRPESPPQLCEDNPGFDRAAFHREFNRAVVRFFRAHLGDDEADRGGG